MNLKKVIANNHPLVEVLGHVMEFSQPKDMITLYLLNKEISKQALEILGIINRPFESQLKGFKPLEATAILSYSEQFLKDNNFVDDNKKINVNMENSDGQHAIDVALLPDIPNKRLILEGLFCRGFDLNLIEKQWVFANQLIYLKVFKGTYKIAMTWIEKNEFHRVHRVWEIGSALARNGGGEEAYTIAMNLIEKNEFFRVWEIGSALARNGRGEEAYTIAKKLKEKNAFHGVSTITRALAESDGPYLLKSIRKSYCTIS